MAQSIPMLNASEPPLVVSSSKKVGIDILRKTIIGIHMSEFSQTGFAYGGDDLLYFN